MGATTIGTARLCWSSYIGHISLHCGDWMWSPNTSFRGGRRHQQVQAAVDTDTGTGRTQRSIVRCVGGRGNKPWQVMWRNMCSLDEHFKDIAWQWTIHIYNWECQRASVRLPPPPAGANLWWWKGPDGGNDGGHDGGHKKKVRKNEKFSKIHKILKKM